MKIKQAARGSSSESTIKSFYRRKDIRGSFQSLTANHAGEVKNPSISNKRLCLLKNIKGVEWVVPLRAVCLTTCKLMMT